jgi:hypothetical protein
MLSMHEGTEYLFEALRASASGYLLRSGADRDLIEACGAAMCDEPLLYPSAIRTLTRDHLDRPPSDGGDILNPRETEIVKLIAEAHSARRSPRCSWSAPRPSSATAPTSSRSSVRATASSHPLRDPARSRRAVARPGA